MYPVDHDRLIELPYFAPAERRGLFLARARTHRLQDFESFMETEHSHDFKP